MKCKKSHNVRSDTNISCHIPGFRKEKGFQLKFNLQVLGVYSGFYVYFCLCVTYFKGKNDLKELEAKEMVQCNHACSVSTGTWVQIPNTHIESWSLRRAPVAQLWRRASKDWQVSRTFWQVSLAIESAGSRFNEPDHPKVVSKKEDAQCGSLAFRHTYTHIHTWDSFTLFYVL